MAVRIQVRRGTSTQWNDADPILNQGEIGYNSTLGQIKIGDGTSQWSALTYLATESELNSSLADYIEIIEKGAADGVAELNADKNVLTQSSIIFEGATTNSYQTTVTVTDPTNDRTITFPDSTGTVVLSDGSGNVTITGNLTVNGTTTTIDTQNLVVEDKNITLGYGATSDAAVDGGGITLTGATNKTFNWVDATDSWTSSENLNLASGKTVKIDGTDVLSSTQVLGKSVPTGTIVGTSDAQTLTNKTISGSDNTLTNIANSSLTNSSITINGTPISLGGSVTIAGDIEGVTASTGLTGGGTSGTVTLAVDTSVVATTNNTLTMSNKTLTTPVISGLALSDSSIVFEGSVSDDFETTLTVTNPTADRTITLPDVSGTVVTTGDTGTVTSTMIANGTIVDGDISASAAIDKTKISGTAITAADTGTVTSTMIANGTIVNADINDSAAIAVSKLSASTISGVTLGNNLNALTISTGLSGTSYNGSSAVTIAVDSTIATTSSSQTITNKTIGAGNALGADLSAATYKITNLGTPSADADAATKAYVDSMTAGLNVHASAKAATTSNVNLSNQLENGDTLDGVTLATGNRVLVKNQSTTSENGVYVVQASGAAVRASDYDSVPEVDAGDFIFVESGTVNGKTGWVQTNNITTLGVDPIEFTQFSGAGTYQAGTGLTLTGNIFSINTATTVDLSTAQTLTNKTLALGSNTVSGTIAQFNTALTDADFATLAGSETFSNKTLTSPIITGLTLNDSSIVFEGSTADAYETTLTVVDPTADRTITLPNKTGTVALEGYLPSSLTWGDLKNGKSA